MTESIPDATDAGEAAEKVRGMLAGLIEAMGFKAEVAASVQEETGVFLRVECPEAADLIGPEGALLEAVQYVMNRMIRRTVGDAWFCMVDVGGYRERRRNSMASEALDVAGRVRRTGRPFTFPPLSPSDRRAIHRALADENDVETVSHEPAPDGSKRLTVRLRPADGPSPEKPGETPL